MKRPRTPETEIAAAVVSWLADSAFDVYQEVTCRSARADIVGLGLTEGSADPAPDGEVIAAEVKHGLGLDLLAQGIHWARSGFVHKVWLCALKPTPATLTSGAWWLARRIAVENGLGVALVRVTGEPGEPPSCVEVVVEPKLLDAPRAAELRRVLDPAHKTSAPAGSPGSDGGYFTPFRKTCDTLRRIVAAHEPGLTMRDAVSLMSRVEHLREDAHGVDGTDLARRYAEHHYASDAGARGTLSRLIRDGAIPGLKLEPQAEGHAVLVAVPWRGY